MDEQGADPRSELFTEPTLPYVVVRHFPAIYERLPVRFVNEAIGPSSAGKALVVHVPPGRTQPTVDGRALLVARLVQLSRSSGRKTCAVFGPADAVYVEPTGETRASADIPSGGHTRWPYPWV
ncbi:MAG TPA: hypothetical protein VK988_03160 [Acidimicrobiales bacterium]|nr:hypothetical protein [Acidimicrobiales bacterium]